VCSSDLTLNIEDIPVTIKTVECAIVDKAWENGWIKPQVAPEKTGKKIAVIGGGPSGLAAAQQLSRVGHDVHLFEKNAKVGGLLRYGIPDFKLDKTLIDRRVTQMEAEGVTFHYGAHIGVTQDAKQLIDSFDAVLICAGSEKSRDLPIPGRDLDGVHFAMEFLPQQNRRVSGEAPLDNHPIMATGKHVVVIGGGDTGSDCIGTSVRHGAASVVQLEIMPKPPEKENKDLTWPNWPLKLRTSSSHQEGATRDFSVATKECIGENGKVKAIKCIRLGPDMKEVPGTEFELKADLVLLAMGFVHPVHEGMLKNLGLKLDARGNVDANVKDYKTSHEKVFAAGDVRRGQSLVVWAIREGRQAARAIDEFLMGTTILPR
jgi:glutamate synthase (NADPH/NADH) small chain